MKVHGVKRVVEIEPWALAQVMKHDAARMERLGLYRPTVQPKFAGIFSVYLYDDHIGVVARRRVGHGVKRHVELATGRRQGVLLNSLDEWSVLVGQPQYMLHPPVEDVSLCHDKLSVNYLAFVKLASIRIWLRPRPNLNIPRNRLE
jgi:hypothetical protein